MYFKSLVRYKHIEVERLHFRHPQLPKAFRGYKILHVSDLHSRLFGKNQSVLIKHIEDAQPDCIVITGDLICCRNIRLGNVLCFVEQAVKLAPVYVVSGNHEGWVGNYQKIKHYLIKAGAVVLDDQMVKLRRSHKSLESLVLVGLKDKIIPDTHDCLEMLTKDCHQLFTIVLSHRPEYIDTYAQFPVHLVFSGHAHGGQIRLPFLGGLYAPGQGFLPNYTSGMYQKKQTTMIVSRGLGKSRFPFRVFNCPHLVVVTLDNV